MHACDLRYNQRRLHLRGGIAISARGPTLDLCSVACCIPWPDLTDRDTWDVSINELHCSTCDRVVRWIARAPKTVVSLYICEWLNRNTAVVRVVSISNIVISILITSVEESLNDVKMMRLALAILILSVIIAGNSQHSVQSIRILALLAVLTNKLT